MDTISLVDLGPVIAAVLGPMLAFVVVSMRYQHVESVKTRELIERSSKETLERAGELIQRSVGELGVQLAEHRRDTKQSLREVTGSLADARERLARIEGHLGIGAPPPGEAGEAAPDAV